MDKSKTRNNRLGLAQRHFTSKKSGAGFTIIEMIIAVALFAVVALVSVSSILSIVDANQKARSLKSVMDNLHFALQGMSLALQVAEGSLVCSGGNCSLTGGTTLSFESADAEDVTYEFSAGSLFRSVDGGPPIAVTAPELRIDSGRFFLSGEGPTDNRQPLVIVTIEGVAGPMGKTESSFFVQTSITPRRLDD